MKYLLAIMITLLLTQQLIAQDNMIHIQLDRKELGIVTGDFIVEDEQGRRTGWDYITNTKLREIPNVHYGEEGIASHDAGPSVSWVEWFMPVAIRGTYKITVIGTGSDSCILNIQMARPGDETTIFNFDIFTSPGQITEYEIFYDPDTAATLTAKLVLTPRDIIETVRDDLQDLIDADPGSPLADKLEDARDKLNSALSKLDANDVQEALGEIEGAVGDIQAAVDDGLLAAVTGNKFMDDLAGAARTLAFEAIDDEIARNGDPGKISDAQTALADGDVDRANLMFKDAVANYKDAVSQAEGA